jgi:hypothetical protein
MLTSGIEAVVGMEGEEEGRVSIVIQGAGSFFQLFLFSVFEFELLATTFEGTLLAAVVTPSIPKPRPIAIPTLGSFLPAVPLLVKGKVNLFGIGEFDGEVTGGQAEVRERFLEWDTVVGDISSSVREEFEEVEPCESDFFEESEKKEDIW